MFYVIYHIRKPQKTKNSFMNEEGRYSPLTWMFYNRRLNNRINNIHRRIPRLTCKGNQFSYKELLEKDDFVKVH